MKNVGGRQTINADEISVKFLIRPRTLWHDAGGPPPLMASNHTGKEAFTMILATTAGGHKLKPALFVVGKTARSLKKFDCIKDQVELVLVHNRWLDQEMWDTYVEKVFVPWTKSQPASFVVDSHNPHISEFAGDVYAHHFITPIQVPEGMTGRLQPNDVGVYGPLNAIVSRLWLEQKREKPEKPDSIAVSIERYFCAWTQLERDTIRGAWMEAVPELGTLIDEVRQSR